MKFYAVIAAAMYCAAAFAVPPQHVIIIGCDGMSPDGIVQANTPFMDGMMREGAWTLHARGVMPTSSSPNWASMIMGAGPEQHGVTSNDWQVDKFEIAPTVKDDSGRFPTVFALLKQQKPEATAAVFHDWDGFGRLLNRSDVVEMHDCDGPAKTIEAAIAYVKEHKPTLTFIHLDQVDHVGHEVGHGTPEYYAAVEEADKYIGQVLQACAEAGIAGDTAVLVTADHGGVAKGHGGATMAEIEIPWILTGAGVKRGVELTSSVNTYDTAGTIAFLLGLTPHPNWIAKVIAEALE